MWLVVGVKSICDEDWEKTRFKLQMFRVFQAQEPETNKVVLQRQWKKNQKQIKLLKAYCAKDTLAIYYLVKYLLEQSKDI